MHVCVCVCVCVCVRACMRARVCGGMIWTPYDWLNKFYNFCTAAKVAKCWGFWMFFHMSFESVFYISKYVITCETLISFYRQKNRESMYQV